MMSAIAQKHNLPVIYLYTVSEVYADELSTEFRAMMLFVKSGSSEKR